jgi:hypothetical protein
MLVMVAEGGGGCDVGNDDDDGANTDCGCYDCDCDGNHNGPVDVIICRHGNNPFILSVFSRLNPW